MRRTLVFTRTKHGADQVVRHLHMRGIRAEAIHGNKSQNARTARAATASSRQDPPVLVATDIASRGIDVDGITHVINFDMPARAGDLRAPHRPHRPRRRIRRRRSRSAIARGARRSQGDRAIDEGRDHRQARHADAGPGSGSRTCACPSRRAAHQSSPSRPQALARSRPWRRQSMATRTQRPVRRTAAAAIMPSEAIHASRTPRLRRVRMHRRSSHSASAAAVPGVQAAVARGDASSDVTASACRL